MQALAHRCSSTAVKQCVGRGALLRPRPVPRLSVCQAPADRSVRAMSGSNGNGVSQTASNSGSATITQGPLNVLGTPLQSCCTSPVTGFYRDGFCRTDEADRGRHVVCARVTSEFLEYSKSKGNDLMTPAPWYNFPGLKDGDRWCLCVSRWAEALDAGVAPPLYLSSSHIKALEYVTIDQLKAYALDLDSADN